MNLYLCSTVRNLLLALLRSTDTRDVESYILVICDQQNINRDDYDLSFLPANIKVQFIFRNDIRHRLDATLRGRMIRLLGAMKIKTTTRLRATLAPIIFNDLLNISSTLKPSELTLFLFNDRNRVARLLRLAVEDYRVIEDGLANYYGSQLSFSDKLRNAISRTGRSRRYIGDDKRCLEVYLLRPDNAPATLRHKVRPIEFINSKYIIDVCYGFFRHELPAGKRNDVSCILATQPIALGELSKSGFDLTIYRKILDRLHQKNVHVVIKVHPRENFQRYADAFPGEQLIGGKLPLELLIFGSNESCDIVSIYSSAGMGFERYCRRLTLINDSESAQMAEFFVAWRNDTALLDRRINQLLG